MKFSLFDILLCIAIAAGVLFFIHRPEKPNFGIRYTLLCTADAALAAHIKEGARVLDGVGKAFCGEIRAVCTEDALLETAEGVFRDPCKKRITLTVEGKGYEENAVFRIGTLTLAPGKIVCMHAPCFLECICLSVQRSDTA